MAATVSWIDDDQTILSIRYDNPIQVEDILRALDQLTAQVETAPAPVDLIVDITAARGIPPHDFVTRAYRSIQGSVIPMFIAAM